MATIGNRGDVAIIENILVRVFLRIPGRKGHRWTTMLSRGGVAIIE